MVQEIQLKGFPCPVKSGYVYYVEKKVNKSLNSFIRKNYEWLKMAFKKEGLQFVYLPIMGDELVSYNAPYLNEEQRDAALKALDLSAYIDIEDLPSSLVFASSEIQGIRQIVCQLPIETHWYKSKKVVFEHLLRTIFEERRYQKRFEEYHAQILKEEREGIRTPIRHSIDTSEECGDVKYSLSTQDEDTKPYSIDLDELLLQQATKAKESIMFNYEGGVSSSSDGIRYSRRYAPEPKKPADETFDDESKKLIHEIQERIDALRGMGLSTLFLHGLIDKGEKLSRLRVTKDKRIFLPDYNNMEICLPELPKAVFLLFLRHPEGIRFKELTDYRDEFRTIYLSLNPRGSMEKNERSIREVTNPMSNSINEKCARIREAFIAKFDERLAEKYYITGKKGEPKKITLAPELIIWDA